MSTPSRLVPHLIVEGAADAIAFYRKAFGATETMRLPAEDGKRLMHAELQINGERLYLVDDFVEHRDQCGGGKMMSPKTAGSTGVLMHLDVDDCDAAFQRAADAGATVIMPPWDAFWGDRYAQVVDPFGHGWSFASRLPAKT